MDVESSACLGMEELGLLSVPKIAAPPCGKLKIILKLKKKEDKVVPGPAVVPPTTTSSSSLENSMKLKLRKEIEEIVVPGPALVSSSSEENNSMKLKLEATKRKLEQSYGEEAEKKAKKKIQRIDNFPKSKNHAGISKVKDGEVQERVLTNLKKLKKKNQNLKPKFALHSRPNF